MILTRELGVPVQLLLLRSTVLRPNHSVSTYRDPKLLFSVKYLFGKANIGLNFPLLEGLKISRFSR